MRLWALKIGVDTAESELSKSSKFTPTQANPVHVKAKTFIEKQKTKGKAAIDVVGSFLGCKESSLFSKNSDRFLHKISKKKSAKS